MALVFFETSKTPPPLKHTSNHHPPHPPPTPGPTHTHTHTHTNNTLYIEKSNFNFTCFKLSDSDIPREKWVKYFAIGADPLDLGLHCLSITILWVSRQNGLKVHRNFFAVFIPYQCLGILSSQSYRFKKIILLFLSPPPPFSVGAYSISAVGTYVCLVRPVHNKNGFRSISCEKISVLDSSLVPRYIITKCWSSLNRHSGLVGRVSAL